MQNFNVAVNKGESWVVELWTMAQVLSEINRDHNEGWEDYDKSDWREGWEEWVYPEYCVMLETES